MVVSRNVGGLLREWVRRLVLCLGAAWLCGCYQFVPAGPEPVPGGSRVRVALTPDVGSRLGAEVSGPGETALEGRVIEMSQAGNLVLEVPGAGADSPQGMPSRSLFSRVTIPQGDVIRLELKRLDRSRTFALVGGGILAAAVVVGVAFGVSSNGSEGEGPPVDQSRIPFLSIRW